MNSSSTTKPFLLTVTEVRKIREMMQKGFIAIETKDEIVNEIKINIKYFKYLRIAFENDKSFKIETNIEKINNGIIGSLWSASIKKIETNSFGFYGKTLFFSPTLPYFMKSPKLSKYRFIANDTLNIN